MGPVMCTTLSNERNINDATSCGGGEFTLPTAEILSGKNARAWVSMVLYSQTWQ